MPMSIKFVPRTLLQPIQMDRPPAQAVLAGLNRVGLPFKFAATGLLFLLPLVLLLRGFQSEINRGIRVAELEREGVAYSRPLTALILDVSQGRRGLAADLRAVDRADRRHGDALGVRADWRRLRAEGQSLEAGGAGRGPGMDVGAWDRFSQHLVTLLTTVGNNSNLILDPDMDSYYTMDTVLTQTPQLVTNVSQVRAVADGADSPNVRQARLAMLMGQVQTPLAAAGDDLRMATGYDHALEPRVAAPFQDLRFSTATFSGLLERFGSSPRLHAEIDRAGDSVFESGRRYNQAGMDALDWVLERRLQAFLTRRTSIDLIAAVSACLAVAFFGGLYRTTMRTIQQVLQAQREMRQSEGRYRSLVESSPDAIVVYVESGLVYVNGAALTLLGAAKTEEVLGRPVLDFVHPEFHASMRERAALSQREGRPNPLSQQQYIRLDGRVIDVETVGTPIVWEGQAARQVLIRDITERKAVEEAVRESEARLRTVIANVPVVVFALDAQGVYTFSDGQGLAALGLAPGEIVGRSVFEVYQGQPALLEHLHAALSGTAHTWTLEVGGRTHETHTTPLRDALGRLTGVAGAAYDLTEHKRLETQLAHQAFHDALTGLPNRALFLDRLEHARARAERRHSSVAVLFVDLDNFKVVNDSLGHAAGDALLSAVAQRLSACIRPGDTIARLGGDEFTVLLEEVTGGETPTEVAGRIAEALRLPLTLEGRTLFVSASIGIAQSSLEASGAAPTQPGDLLREADIAMYQAKNGGRARCAVFDRQMNAQAMERMELEGDLRRAIAQDELVLHYQPIVSLASGALQEVEALVRWEHPCRGLIAPLTFIPIAEESGLIVPLGLWVLRAACRQARRWQQEHPQEPPLVIGVNLSGRQLEQPDLVAQVSAVLTETGLPAASLKLEITESVMMANAEQTTARMQELKALGVRLAVDDFGTGYSSMAYLGAFPLDTLKIDRAFVSKMDEPEGEAILQAIVTLAHSLHLQITTEGIETQDQWRRLQALGCERGQGYYFARPQTSEALAAMLAETTTLSPALALPPASSPALRA